MQGVRSAFSGWIRGPEVVPVQAADLTHHAWHSMPSAQHSQAMRSPAGACRLPHALVRRVCMCGTSCARAGTSQGCRWRSAGGNGARRGRLWVRRQKAIDARQNKLGQAHCASPVHHRKHRVWPAQHALRNAPAQLLMWGMTSVDFATNQCVLAQPMTHPPAQFLMCGMIMCRMMMRTCWCSSVCGRTTAGEIGTGMPWCTWIRAMSAG